MNEETEPDFCARCMQEDPACRCYTVNIPMLTVPHADLLVLRANLLDILAGFTKDDAANYDDTNPEDTYYNVAWALECLNDTLNTYTPTATK